MTQQWHCEQTQDFWVARHGDLYALRIDEPIPAPQHLGPVFGFAATPDLQFARRFVDEATCTAWCAMANVAARGTKMNRAGASNQTEPTLRRVEVCSQCATTLVLERLGSACERLWTERCSYCGLVYRSDALELFSGGPRVIEFVVIRLQTGEMCHGTPI